jgi:hypothetical protein
VPGQLIERQKAKNILVTYNMEIGVDSFAAMFSANSSKAISDADAMAQLLDRIVYADKMGLDVFGIGEHHRKGFLDSAPTLILAAALPGQNVSGLQVRLWCLVQPTR